MASTVVTVASAMSFSKCSTPAATSATPAQSEEKKPPVATKSARTEDIVFHLYGMLLWQQSSPSPLISPDILGAYLQELLGEGRIRTLEDWSPEEKNKAVFLVEQAYETVEGKVIKTLTQDLLRELKARILRASLAETRKELANAERIGDTTLRDSLLSLCNTIQQRLRTEEKTNEQEFVL